MALWSWTGRGFNSGGAEAPRRLKPAPLSFRNSGNLGQDDILRAGWQPALVRILLALRGGLTTRRRLPTCPTNSCRFPLLGKPSGNGRKPAPQLKAALVTAIALMAAGCRSAPPLPSYGSVPEFRL